MCIEKTEKNYLNVEKQLQNKVQQRICITEHPLYRKVLERRQKSPLLVFLYSDTFQFVPEITEV